MNERRNPEAHGQRSVMGLVVKHLYFGLRPAAREMAANGSILRNWNANGYDWDALARVVEGLAIRRNQGDLKSVGRDQPLSLRWLNDKDQLLNQAAVCMDALYRSAPVEPEQKRGGTVTGIGDLLTKFAKGA